MNYGMRCHDISGSGTVEEVLDRVVENGILQIQLAMGISLSEYDFSGGHYSPGLAHRIRRELDKRGIHVAVLGCYINPTDPDEARRQAAVNKFIEHLKFAKILGADMVGTETGRFDSQMRITPYTYTEGCYQTLLKSMRQIVSAAEKLGATVGVESVHSHTLYCPEMMRRFLEDIDSPNVEVILDPVNLLCAENVAVQDEVVEKAFRLYGDKISVFHVKDFVMDGETVKPAGIGEGQFHFEPFLRLVKSQKPYAAMLLEESNPRRCHEDVRFLQQIYERV